jgi:predicted dehydrogenase
MMTHSAIYTASVIGAGMGGQLSIQALAASERYQLVAVADLRPEVCKELESQYPGLRTFTSHQEMFALCPTDVVCVSTYAPSHEAITLDALELPLKGILVEKPLGDTYASGQRILQAITMRNLPMVVPHGLLVKATPREIIKRVHAGEIGDLKLVEIQSPQWDIINAGIHWLNFFVNLTNLDPLESVLAQCDTATRTFRDGMQVETLAVTYAQTKGGVRVVMQTGDDVKTNAVDKDFSFRLIGTRGQIEFWAWEASYHLLNSMYPEGHMFTPYESPRVNNHQVHLENLAGHIDTATPDYRVAESSLMALALCEGAYLSSRYRCQVTFPLESFTPPLPNDWNPGEPYSGHGGGRDGRKL